MSRQGAGKGTVQAKNHRAYKSGKVHEAKVQADVEKAVGKKKDTVTKTAAR